jgi:hypothetical protein
VARLYEPEKPKRKSVNRIKRRYFNRKQTKRGRKKNMKTHRNKLIAVSILSAAWLSAASAFAHCDTLDGPVVADARIAIEKKEITPVLKWIKPEHEPELKTAFTRTLTVRSQSKEARELADQFFFETLVRVHREGEGAPYTGIKPVGTKLDPAIETADQALESGKSDALIKAVTDETVAGIRKRFADAVEKKQHATHNVEAGREYVAAYVEFVHYVEMMHATATRPAHAHGNSGAAATGATVAHEHH